MARFQGLATAIAVSLALVIIWLPRWPPWGDMPQHAAQVHLLLQLAAPGEAPNEELYQLNLVTPYLVGYGLTFMLAHLVSVVAAIKIVLSLYLFAFLGSSWALLRHVDAPLAWMPLLVPVALGHPFQWGFLNFLVGMPLLVLFMVLAVSFLRTPSWRGGLGVGLLSVALIPVHVVIAAFAAAAGAGMAIVHAGGWHRRGLTLLPFLAPLPILAAWVVATGSNEPVAQVPVEWGLSWTRVLTFAMFLAGNDITLGALLFGGFLLAAPLLLGARPSRVFWRWVPFTLAVIAFAVVPARLYGTYLLWARMSVVAYPFWLFAMDPGPPRLPHAGVRGAFALLPTLWLAVQLVRVHLHQVEVEPLARLIGSMPGEQRLAFLVFDRDGAMNPSAYYHLPVWYTVERSGVADFSYAVLFPQMVRFAPGADLEFPEGAVFWPETYDFHDMHGERWEWFMIHSREDPAALVFDGAAERPALFSREGNWWLFRAHDAD